MNKNPLARLRVPEILVRRGETLVVYLEGEPVAPGVELRVLPDGRRQVFVREGYAVEVLDLKQWTPMAEDPEND